jgi:hypothetical protein
MLTYFGIFTPLNVGRSVGMDVLRSYDAPAAHEPVSSIQPRRTTRSIGQTSAACAGKRPRKDHQSHGDMHKLNQVPEQRSAFNRQRD